NSYAARRLNSKTTGNCGGVYNLEINSTLNTLAELLKTMHTGLLVTDLIGQGVNLITGDYSKGVAGFWVENGIIQYPVAEITVAGNLKQMFLDIVAVANDVDYRGNITTGSILINEMTVAGT
ncbi:MAG: metalloprotease PmbA, partial [Legionellales bacterium]